MRAPTAAPSHRPLSGRTRDCNTICTATTTVPPSASTSAIVIVISPRIVGSVVSNSTTSTTNDGLPRGVSAADNELGWQISLGKLAALVEAG